MMMVEPDKSGLCYTKHVSQTVGNLPVLSEAAFTDSNTGMMDMSHENDLQRIFTDQCVKSTCTYFKAE
jgi:hypothetical protein